MEESQRQGWHRTNQSSCCRLPSAPQTHWTCHRQHHPAGQMSQLQVHTHAVSQHHFARWYSTLNGGRSHLLTVLTLMALSLCPRGRPCPSSPLVPVQGHILGNTHACHVVLDLLVPRLLGTSSSSSTWYCQLHHSAGDVVCISSLDMCKPTKTATAHNLVDR